MRQNVHEIERRLDMVQAQVSEDHPHWPGGSLSPESDAEWAFRPNSGGGAGIDSGRFNRPGVDGLNVTEGPQTAFDE